MTDRQTDNGAINNMSPHFMGGDIIINNCIAINTYSLNKNTSCVKVGSHWRSDQLDHPDPLNFQIELNQARHKGVYTNSFRPLVNHRG